MARKPKKINSTHNSIQSLLNLETHFLSSLCNTPGPRESKPVTLDGLMCPLVTT